MKKILLFLAFACMGDAFAKPPTLAYQPTKKKIDQPLRNIAKVTVGVALCVASLYAAHKAYESYQDLLLDSRWDRRAWRATKNAFKENVSVGGAVAAAGKVLSKTGQTAQSWWSKLKNVNWSFTGVPGAGATGTDAAEPAPTTPASPPPAEPTPEPENTDSGVGAKISKGFNHARKFVDEGLVTRYTRTVGWSTASVLLGATGLYYVGDGLGIRILQPHEKQS